MEYLKSNKPFGKYKDSTFDENFFDYLRATVKPTNKPKDSKPGKNPMKGESYNPEKNFFKQKDFIFDDDFFREQDSLDEDFLDFFKLSTAIHRHLMLVS